MFIRKNVFVDEIKNWVLVVTLAIDFVDFEDHGFVLEAAGDESSWFAAAFSKNAIVAKSLDNILLIDIKKAKSFLRVRGEIVFTDHDNFWLNFLQIQIFLKCTFRILYWNFNFHQALALTFDHEKNGRNGLLDLEDAFEEFHLVFHSQRLFQLLRRSWSYERHIFANFSDVSVSFLIWFFA